MIFFPPRRALPCWRFCGLSGRKRLVTGHMQFVGKSSPPMTFRCLIHDGTQKVARSASLSEHTAATPPKWDGPPIFLPPAYSLRQTRRFQVEA